MIFKKHFILTNFFTLWLICNIIESKPVDVNDFYEFLGGNEEFLNRQNHSVVTKSNASKNYDDSYQTSSYDTSNATQISELQTEVTSEYIYVDDLPFNQNISNHKNDQNVASNTKESDDKKIISWIYKSEDYITEDNNTEG